MTEGLLIFAGLIAHAWIGKIISPSASANAVAWVVGVILTLIALYFLLAQIF